MAYRRSIAARAKLFYQQQHRAAPSFPQIHRDDTKTVSRDPEISSFIQRRFYNNFSNFHGSRNAFQDRRFAMPSSCGSVFSRNYSGTGVGEGDILNDVVGVVGEKAVEVAPLVNEVAVAAADSAFPVAALQYLVDYVHCFTGFSWWASIVATTLLIRTLQIPLMINQLKATSKFSLIKPQLDAINQEMKDKGMSPSAVSEGQAKMKGIMNKYGVTPFTPLKGLLISGPVFCSFFFAISNMAEKVPSFKDGGILWFTDLTTPDSMYIFPVLTALTFWVMVECNALEGLEGNPNSRTIKNVTRAFAALAIPLTASFPKAIFCYWITSNLFSLAYGLTIKKPEVKKFLGLPDLPPPPPPSSNPQPSLSFFEMLKKYAAAQQEAALMKSSAAKESSKPAITQQRIPASSVLNQRIKSLEKEVKGRKRGKKGKKM